MTLLIDHMRLIEWSNYTRALVQEIPAILTSTELKYIVAPMLQIFVIFLSSGPNSWIRSLIDNIRGVQSSMTVVSQLNIIF